MKGRRLVKHVVQVCRRDKNYYDVIRSDYRTSDGLLVFHNVYKGLARREAYDLRREIMGN